MDNQTEAKNIQDFVDKGNYHAAYNTALSGLNACRRNKDQAGVQQFLHIIQGVVDSLTAEFSDPSKY